MKYEDTNIWIASALASQGVGCKAEKIGTLKSGKGKYLFIFEADTPESEKIIKDTLEKYHRSELLIDVKTLEDNYRVLKNLTFN
jgi:hypothetical protein